MSTETLTPTDALNALCAIVTKDNDRWWRDPATGEPKARNLGEMQMLVVTELAEAVEGDRKNLMDDKLPHRPMREVELADAYIRLLDLAGHYAPGELYADIDEQDVLDWLDGDDNFGSVMLKLTREVCSLYTDFNATDLSWVLATIRAAARAFGLDLAGATTEKLAYNRTRADHTNEARLAATGKKY